MADTLYKDGKEFLWKYGWDSANENGVNQIRLYTDTGTLVDTKSCSMTYADGKLSLDSDIEFDVLTATNDISYVIITNYSLSSVLTLFYRKDLSQLYDFETSGKLLLEQLDLSVASSTGLSLTDFGKDTLFTSGWLGITKAEVSGNITLINDITFSAVADGTDYILQMTSGVNTFVITAGNNITTVKLSNSTGDYYWSRTLSGAFSPTVTSDFRILEWAFSL